MKMNYTGCSIFFKMVYTIIFYLLTRLFFFLGMYCFPKLHHAFDFSFIDISSHQNIDFMAEIQCVFFRTNSQCMK